MSIVIRAGDDSDTDWIVTQLGDFSKFFGTRYPLFGDEAFIRAGISNFMKNHFVRVAVGCHDGIVERVGFIIGLFTQHPFNPAIKLLGEQFWWVEPKYRNSRAGLLLLNEFVAFGKKNAHWITMALESKSPINEKSLIRRGFKFQEKSYLMEVA